jgi:hypothetical protein
MKNLIVILLSAMTLTAVAQQKIALLEPRVGEGSTEVTSMEKNMVRGELRKAIVNFQGYDAITRNDIDRVMQEQDFQRTGMVSNAQIKELGEMSGADYICVSTLTKSNTEFYIEAYLIHLESGRMSHPATKYGELTGGKLANMLPACQALAAEILGDKAIQKAAPVAQKAVPEEKPKAEKKDKKDKTEKVQPEDVDNAQAEEMGNLHFIRCVAFYNLENLFDTIHDEGKNDYEYLPDGGNKWTSMKYENKIKNMAYAVSQLGTDMDPRGATCVGVAEVENIGCLEDLCAEANSKYNRRLKPILIEGPDRRGVDVGFLYDTLLFKPSRVNGYELKAHYADGGEIKTRLQLCVSGYLIGNGRPEKIHVIVNHWPSRYGGELSSRPGRDTAAMLCRTICDSIYKKEPKAKIIIMGDLNDDPYNHSCKDVLKARKHREEVETQGYFNTMWQMLDRGIGSLAYGGSWNLFDQIIISEPLLNENKDSGRWAYWKAQIFNKPFLTVQEGKDKGTPFRTTKAGVWQNGYGDHYPTMIYLIKKK